MLTAPDAVTREVASNETQVLVAKPLTLATIGPTPGAFAAFSVVSPHAFVDTPLRSTPPEVAATTDLTCSVARVTVEPAGTVTLNRRYALRTRMLLFSAENRSLVPKFVVG